MKLLICGDYSPRHRLNTLLENNQYDSIFGFIKPYIKEVDFGIVNFEGTLAPPNSKKIAKCGPNHSVIPSSIDALNSVGFNVACLANNHIGDFGEEGILATISALESKGFKTVGAGKNLETASSILYLEKLNEKIALINCCEHEFTIATSEKAGANPLNPIKQYYTIQEAKKNSDFVLVIVHGGLEHYQYPTIRMKEIYRFFIDAGASAIINCHQHCFSGYEIYKGCPIFYGIGNFCFDSPKYTKRNKWHYGFCIILNTDNPITFKLIPYEQCLNFPGIFPIEDENVFFEDIKRINTIISSDKKLIELQNQFYSDNSRVYLSILQPYWGKYMTTAFTRSLLPEIFSKKKYLTALNLIECESHVEKLKWLIAQRLGI